MHSIIQEETTLLEELKQTVWEANIALPKKRLVTPGSPIVNNKGELR
ncbi:MAG: hypothetical protein KAJ15_12195 [Spirochaetes bacterium]|nr:hypothetical protein [Spirochaetota bacterium]